MPITKGPPQRQEAQRDQERQQSGDDIEAGLRNLHALHEGRIRRVIAEEPRQEPGIARQCQLVGRHRGSAGALPVLAVRGEAVIASAS